MIEPTKTWLSSVKNAVKNLHEEYRINRGMLLTEGDLECHLFNKILQEENLKGYHDSKEDSTSNMVEYTELKTSYVHSQVTWFKPDEKSGFEVDLTIGDPKMLEVINIELFEKWTSKGFAYDGPCIAIEIKFIRDLPKASLYGHEDYLKLRDRLIPAKLKNISLGRYAYSKENNIAFISLVGCKDKEIFDKAKFYLGKHLSEKNKSCPENLYTCIFYQDEIIWDQNVLINYYEANPSLFGRQ